MNKQQLLVKILTDYTLDDITAVIISEPMSVNQNAYEHIYTIITLTGRVSTLHGMSRYLLGIQNILESYQELNVTALTLQLLLNALTRRHTDSYCLTTKLLIYSAEELFTIARFLKPSSDESLLVQRVATFLSDRDHMVNGAETYADLVASGLSLKPLTQTNW